MIKKVADAKMGQEIFKEIAYKGYEPSEFVIFACGIHLEYRSQV